MNNQINVAVYGTLRSDHNGFHPNGGLVGEMGTLKGASLYFPGHKMFPAVILEH